MSVIYSAASTSGTAPAAFPGQASGAERTLLGITAEVVAGGGHGSTTTGGCS